MSNNNNNNIPKLIYITGIDGSGKSTVSEHLADQLRSKGYEVNILWLRFNHVFSKPLLGLCRLLGYTKYEKPNGIHVGYHDFYKSKIISYLFIFFQYLDAVRVKYTKILPLYRKNNSVIILDRYVYDILIDMSVDTRFNNLFESWIGKKFTDLIPVDSVSILVWRELEDVLDVRPEGKVDRNFESRFEYFKKLKNTSSINTVYNAGTLDELLKTASELTGLSDETKTAG